MIIIYEDTPKTVCVHCGAKVEVISLYIFGTGLHCPLCFGLEYGSGHVGYIPDLRECGVQECHLVEIK